MSRNVNLICADRSLLRGASEIAPMLGLRLSASGVRVEARQGDELSLRRGEEGIVLTYRRKNEFFRGLSLLGKAISSGDQVETGKPEMLCYMADVSRNAVLSIDGAKKMIRLLPWGTIRLCFTRRTPTRCRNIRISDVCAADTPPTR